MKYRFLLVFLVAFTATQAQEMLIYHPISNALVAATSMSRQVGIRASLRF